MSEEICLAFVFLRIETRENERTDHNINPLTQFYNGCKTVSSHSKGKKKKQKTKRCIASMTVHQKADHPALLNRPRWTQLAGQRFGSTAEKLKAA